MDKNKTLHSESEDEPLSSTYPFSYGVARRFTDHRTMGEEVITHVFKYTYCQRHFMDEGVSL